MVGKGDLRVERKKEGEAMMTIVGKGGVVVFSNALFY